MFAAATNTTMQRLSTSRCSLSDAEFVVMLLRSEAQFDSSPTWLYVVSSITFVCIIAASVIVLICR